MLTVTLHDAKTRLAELIARAVSGEPFIITEAGKPMVRVEAVTGAEGAVPDRGLADEAPADRLPKWGQGSL